MWKTHMKPRNYSCSVNFFIMRWVTRKEEAEGSYRWAQLATIRRWHRFSYTDRYLIVCALRQTIVMADHPDYFQIT